MKLNSFRFFGVYNIHIGRLPEDPGVARDLNLPELLSWWQGGKVHFKILITKSVLTHPNQFNGIGVATGTQR